MGNLLAAFFLSVDRTWAAERSASGEPLSRARVVALAPWNAESSVSGSLALWGFDWRVLSERMSWACMHGNS